MSTTSYVSWGNKKNINTVKLGKMKNVIITKCLAKQKENLV